MIDFDALVLAPAHAVFGTPITYFPGAGRPVAIAGVFNDHYADVSLQDGLQVVDTKIILDVRAAALPNLPVQSDLVSVGDVLYAITNVEPDGVGNLKLTLRAASNLDAAKSRGEIP